jgi:hypothetical protein
MAATGCSKPNSMESRIAFFRKHRKTFDAYVARTQRDEVKHDERGYAMPQLFIDSDIKQVRRRGECVEIIFSFMPTDAVPLYIYSPQGLPGVPEEYRAHGAADGTRHVYLKLVPIDDHWFYCEWDD